MTELHQFIGAWKEIAACISGLVIFARFSLEAGRKTDHLFEISKLSLVQHSGNVALLWGEYNLGTMRKFFCLIRHQGACRTLRRLATNGGSPDAWEIERRIRRGTYRDRSGREQKQDRRRFDDKDFVVALTSRH